MAVCEMFLVGILLIQFGWPFDARAEERGFPNRPIQVIVPFGSGSAADITSRILAPYLEKRFKQSFVILNKPGGGSVLGYTIIAKSKPDGYTIGHVSSVFSAGFILHRDLEFTYESFEPICGFVKLAAFFVVRADASWKTLKEFVADAKKNPGRLRYATQGHLTIYHLAATDFCEQAGIKLTHIPQAGVGDAITQLIGKHVEMAVVATTLGHLPAGRLRALAVGTEERLGLYPNIPTLMELGYGVVCAPHTGHMVPKGTPNTIKEKLAQGYLQTLKENQKAISDAFLKLDEFLVILDPSEYAKIMKRDYEYCMRYKGMKFE
jgi:tripartite-type tricarboxylate transporter receptor subunit TctC